MTHSNMGAARLHLRRPQQEAAASETAYLLGLGVAAPIQAPPIESAQPSEQVKP